MRVRQHRALDRVHQRPTQRGTFLLKGGDSLADLNQGVAVSTAQAVKPREGWLDHDNLPSHAHVPHLQFITLTAYTTDVIMGGTEVLAVTSVLDEMHMALSARGLPSVAQ